ncbi:hypothetical protein AVEN_270164-1 [Araneus ventricosus]|uniref:Uncharacterized protein n=1 Tax=Araneus ventricosus TaxID=182803 RepID=A0A4Y2JRA1_ARAVE|nr:hypothetical protein AVEN_270164-1 [Araneus ventricosus]
MTIHHPSEKEVFFRPGMSMPHGEADDTVIQVYLYQWRLSAKAFPLKPFRKPLRQGLRRKDFYELLHRQGLNDKSAKAFPLKPFRKPFPQNLRRKAFYEPPVPSCVAPSSIVVSVLVFQLYERWFDPRLGWMDLKFWRNLQRNRRRKDRKQVPPAPITGLDISSIVAFPVPPSIFEINRKSTIPLYILHRENFDRVPKSQPLINFVNYYVICYERGMWLSSDGSLMVGKRVLQGYIWECPGNGDIDPRPWR